MKVVFTPAALAPVSFPAGTIGTGALVVVLDMGAAYKETQTCDGTTPVTFLNVPAGDATLTYGRMLADNSGFLGTPFTMPATVTMPVVVQMPAGGSFAVEPD